MGSEHATLAIAKLPQCSCSLVLFNKICYQSAEGLSLLQVVAINKGADSTRYYSCSCSSNASLPHPAGGMLQCS